MTEADWVPESCTLPTAERPLRVAEFAELFRALHALDRISPTRAVLRLAGDGATADEARSLAARETACCSFFDFAIEQAGTDVLMTVTVPPAHVGVLDALLDHAQGAPA